MITLGAGPVIKDIVRDIAKKTDLSIISARFHNGLAAAIAAVSLRIRKKTGIDTVVLSGGVFQNNYLSAKAFELLGKRGFNILRHHGLNTNDAGIPIGQLAIAHARLRCA